MLKLKSLITNHWLLVIIIIIASFLRLYNITQLPPGLYPDEAMNGSNALEAIATVPPTGGFKVFYPENNGREGLFINMQALSIYIFGNEPWALRSVSAIFGILTVLGVYFLTKELFPKNRNVALLSAFLIATSFWHINFSRIGFRAITAPFYLTWALYFIIKAVNILKEKYFVVVVGNHRIYIIAAIGGLFYGLGFHSYIAYRATPLLIVIVFIYWLISLKEIRKQLLKVFAIFLIFSFFAGLPLGIYFLKNPQDFFGRTTQVSVFNYDNPIKNLSLNTLKTIGMFFYEGDWNWRHNYAGKPVLFWPISILFAIGILLSLRIFFDKIFRKMSDYNISPFIILFSWLIIVSLPVVISNEGMPHALRAIIMIPPAFILAGFGGVWLYNKLTNNLRLIIFNEKYKLLFVVCCLLFVVLTFQAYYSYFIQWGKNPNVQGAFADDYVQMGRELNALPKELPKYVIVEAQGADVRGIPMPTQTIMFITDTFTPEKQKEKNIFYILPNQDDQIPENSYKTILR